MKFKEFAEIIRQHVEEIVSDKSYIFQTDIEKDAIYEAYLDSFPRGENEVFRERTSHDCQACKYFIRRLGRCVVLDADGNKVSVWDVTTGDTVYQAVADSLSQLVHSGSIEDIFIPEEHLVGTPSNNEQITSSVDTLDTITWYHLHGRLPDHFPTKRTCDAASKKASIRGRKNILLRGLQELTLDALEKVHELIKANDLYKGEEWTSQIETFLNLKLSFDLLDEDKRELWAWHQATVLSDVICRLRNTSIGTLLVDLSADIGMDTAIAKYNAKVDPARYRRAVAKAKSAAAIKAAQKTITDLGLIDALPRRYGRIGDIGINDILFGSEAANQQIEIGADVFDQLLAEAQAAAPNTFTGATEMSILQFLETVLPTASKVEAYLEPKHRGNMVSLTAPQNPDAPSLFKWSNGLGWAYSGNMTDSRMRQNVKAAGGKVDGELRFSIQWNENGDNPNDYDAHTLEPNYNLISFHKKGCRQASSGMLDVDIQRPGGRVAVENIIYTDRNKMPEGEYIFKVHNFAHRGGRSGFRAEIEFDGRVFNFAYNQDLKNQEYVEVARVTFSKKNGFSLKSGLDNSYSNVEIWNLATNAFHEVEVLMHSPNHWESEDGIGNKHYFFMLAHCQNSEKPNGFYNEFLAPELVKHRKVFETLGERMMVQDAQPQEQLSGIGFSSTRRSDLLVKVTTNTNNSRVLRIKF